MRMTLYPCGLLPINTLPQLNHEEDISPIPVEGHYAKYLTSNPQNCQGHYKHGNLRSFTAKRKLRLNVVWDTGWDSGIEKRH